MCLNTRPPVHGVFPNREFTEDLPAVYRKRTVGWIRESRTVKIRLRNDTIRIRASQGEVRMLGEGMPVETATHFGPGQALACRVRAAGASFEASFDGSTIELTIPPGDLQEWAAGSDLALEREQVWTGGSLRVSLEKDLTCTHPRQGEDDSDAFPNPASVSHCG